MASTRQRFLSLLMVFILASLVQASCKEAAQPPPTGEPKSPATGAATAAAKAGWEEKWNSVLTEAKKEGTVTVYSMWTSETRAAVTQALKRKYGINLEFTAFGIGSQLAAKVDAENAAGLYFADAFGVGVPTMITYMRPKGMLAPVKPLLILPEVLDPNAWLGGEMPFSDKAGLFLSMIGNTIRTVAYNTNLVREGEITTYRDLLKPQYKGKITMTDSSVSGNSSIAHLGYNLWGEAAASDFLRRLINEQQLVITRDNRLHIETVARGKYAIALAPSMTTLPVFLAAGAPIKPAIVEEDNRLSAGSGALGLPTRFAHPNTTIVFVNWLLTREGQSVFATSYGMPSTRLDASTEGINPLFIPQPGKKYLPETEGFHEAKDKWMEISKKIMEEAAK